MKEQGEPDGVVWLDGEYTDFSSAQVALEDRGFEFGDGVYEVIRAYDGRPFAMAEHMTRLANSAAGIELELPMPVAEIGALAEEVLRRSRIDNAEIYIQVTRGAARRYHLFPKNTKPTIVVGARDLRDIPEGLWETGCRVVTLPDDRWAHCNLKTICLLPNVLAKQRAYRAGAFEAVLVRDGLVTEGTSCNIFMWQEGELITPVADNRILPGITRAVTIRVARARGYNVVERDIRLEELLSAQEVFLTSTSIELLPVIKVDDQVIGTGRPGDVRGDLHAAFRALTADDA